MGRKNNAFRICPLASGSKGNSVFVSTPDTALLIDAGLSGKEIQRRLEAVGETPESLSAIIVTHEHSDHVRGAGVLSRRFDIPLYITPRTWAAAQGLGEIQCLSHFECGHPFDINGLHINPFSISHDASDPVGLTLEYESKKIGIATDLGIATNLVRQHLMHCNVLYIESNHDPDLLMNGPYPWHLKQRIKSRTGHLSNPDTRELITDLMHPHLQHVILAHLSEENNRPHKAHEEVAKGLNGSNIGLTVAGPDRPGDMIRL